MRYVISYDLLKPGQNYEKLWAELERFKAKRVLESQWVIRRSNTTAKNLRDHFKEFVDANDRLLIVCIDDSDWAGRNLRTKISSV